MQFEDDSGRICTIAGPSAHRNPKFGSSCKQLNGWPGSRVSKLASNRRERRSCTLKLAMIPAGICSRLSSLSIHLSTTSPTSEILLPCYVYTVSPPGCDIGHDKKLVSLIGVGKIFNARIFLSNELNTFEYSMFIYLFIYLILFCVFSSACKKKKICIECIFKILLFWNNMNIYKYI